jgi:hypothetical protein
MAKRWLIGGVAVGVAALIAMPDGRLWLRRRLGLEPEDRRWFEEDEAGTQPEYEGDEPLDTRESRFSLRARLSEDGHGAAAVAADPVEEAATAEPQPGPAIAEATPEPQPEPPVAEATPEPEPEPPVAEVTPEPEPPVAEPAPEPTPFAAAEPPAAEPAAPVAPPAPEPAPFGAIDLPVPPAAPAEHEDTPEPGAEPEPEPERYTAPAHETGYMTYESVPAISPEADAPKSPGEDTDEVEPLPSASAWEPRVAAPSLPPPELHPAAPAPNRPFSEGTSFRSAIDAARERVHDAAREATRGEPSDDETA